MGEPLDNYSNVVEACQALIDRKRWNLAHGRVTVSTVGIASKIRKLTKELPEISLALSLHAPNQRLRSQIVPTAKHYPIEDIIDALDGHMTAALEPRKNDANTNHRSKNNGNASSRRRAMIEYVMCKYKNVCAWAMWCLEKLHCDSSINPWNGLFGDAAVSGRRNFNS